MTDGVSRQTELYMRSGPLATAPIAYEDWEQRARHALQDGPFDYVAGGAGAEDTMRANREAFNRWRIVPRALRDVSQRDLSTTVLGVRLPVPLALAPVGVQAVVHPDAERGPAKAAAEVGIPFTLSTVSSVTIEEVAEVMGDSVRWFQLYPVADPDVLQSLVHRAEVSGYAAIVLTIDTTILGWRERDLRNHYLPFLQGEGLANFFSDPAFRSRLAEPPEENPPAAIMHWFTTFSNPKLCWRDFDRIRALTRLPVLVKGILHPDDARAARDAGADGVIVSNHGGRQVDGAIAALDALSAIRGAVGPDVPVFMDSGIRHGADAQKALALGANVVLLGRPYVYALAAAGEQGVVSLLRNFIADLDLQLALSGCRSVSELSSSMLIRA